MAIQRCPQCSTPLTDDEALALACPLCAAPFQAPAPPPPEAKPEPPLIVPWGWIAVVSVLSLLCLALWLTRPLHSLSVPVEESEAYRSLLAAKQRAESDDAPKQAEKARIALQRKLDERTRERDEEREKRTDAEKKLAEALVKAEAAEKRATEALEVVRLDKPTAIHRIEAMRDGEKIKLAGRVGTLRVAGIESGAILDARALNARLIVIERGISGKAKVILSSPGGIVMLPPIDGGSEVEIDAPNGRVSVRSVNGDSKVKIRAREAQFGGAINGANTEVRVTLSKHGALNFDQILGGKLFWKKEDSGDPMPRLGKGAVRSPGEFIEGE